MKKRLVVGALLAMMLAHPVWADEEKPTTSFWETLRKKIELLTPRKRIESTTAVGGVRGAQADADDVYWKGEAKPQVVDADEITVFRKAMTLADDGDKAGAQAAFADFVKKHPDSKLREDAEHALAELQAKK